MDSILQDLNKTFKITRGDLGYYISLKVSHSIDRGTTRSPTSHAVTHRILNRVGMQDCHPVSTPNIELNIHPDSSESTTPIHVPYKEVVRSLTCLSTLTHPDTTYSLNTVAKYSKNPRAQHRTAVKRILRYLKGIADFGIVYSTNFVSDTVQGFCDADFGGGVDTSLPVPHRLCVSTQGRFDSLEQPRPEV